MFRGTRVPLHFLFGYLADGGNLDEFLLDYPTPEREQAVRAIQLGGLLLEAMAYECALTETGDSPHPPGYNYREDNRSISRESVTTQLHEAACWVVPRPCRRSYPWVEPIQTHTRFADTAGLLCTRLPSGVTSIPSGVALGGRRSQPELDTSVWWNPAAPRDLVRRPRNRQSADRRRADPNAGDEYGRTPVEWATQRGEHQLAKVIAEAERPPQRDASLGRMREAFAEDLDSNWKVVRMLGG